MQSYLLVDSRTEIEINWEPNDVLPQNDDPNSYSVDVYVYMYTFKDREWTQRSVTHNLTNNGHTVLPQINGLSKFVRILCIQVTVEEISDRDSTTDAVKSIRGMSNKPFPFHAGIWSGLVFSIENARAGSNDSAIASRNEKLRRHCSRWEVQQSGMSLTFLGLPACPPTQDRAELPNSGLDEARFDSVLYNTDYQTQWIEYFNKGASKCFTQATVTR